jgi:hypothetical protein
MRSFNSLVSGFPVTTIRFSRTENWTIKEKALIRISQVEVIVKGAVNIHNIKSNGLALSTYFMVSWSGWRCYRPWTYSLHRCLAEVARLQ